MEFAQEFHSAADGLLKVNCCVHSLHLWLWSRRWSPSEQAPGVGCGQCSGEPLSWSSAETLPSADTPFVASSCLSALLLSGTSACWRPGVGSAPPLPPPCTGRIQGSAPIAEADSNSHPVARTDQEVPSIVPAHVHCSFSIRSLPARLPVSIAPRVTSRLVSVPISDAWASFRSGLRGGPPLTDGCTSFATAPVSRERKAPISWIVLMSGPGNTTVVFLSTPISISVWRLRSWSAKRVQPS